MSGSSKFGTFGGVFTPSILTILGVIMYLRLPMMVGNSGLATAIGIIVVAHVISVTTGLSISSIATDKNVGAGGPYYIVSRSLGLPIGGTLGVALFLGLSFSISLYVIGFCESFLSFADIEVTKDNIRIAGTITIAALTAVTLISTAFAIKTQYLILGLIGASLLSVFFGGSVPVPAGPVTAGPPDAPSLEILFGIFFPAVTGFTAGVNMSGDLKDPKRSIPVGTMAAIGVGLVVYISLAVFLAYRVDPAQLVGNSNVLAEISVFGPLVIAGVWGATLSSALGSILGAPRILQALSVDRITPRWFALGHGKGNEPRRALLLAFALGWGGILIAELDVIAAVVSMVFLATYGFLNLSSAIESWASPDFRPSFRIPRLVSIVGALTCVAVMTQLDFLAMVASIALLTGMFLFLKRRQLTLDAGDTWEGIWSSIVRAGLHRLSRSRGQRRNWRPNVLSFSRSDGVARPAVLELARAVITGNGLLTDFEVRDVGAKAPEPEPGHDDDDEHVGVFHRPVECEDFYETVYSACRHHGFSGLDPNTVLLAWDVDRSQPERFVELLASTQKLDFNLLLLRYDPEREWGARERIDIWWRPTQGNVGLSLALMRFLTRFEQWEGARLRFLLVSEDASLSDDLIATMRGLLADARLDAKVKLVTLPSRAGFEDAVRQESSDADLVVMGLPELAKLDIAGLAALDTLLNGLGTVLFVGGSSLFAEVLPVSGFGGVAEAIERAESSATEMRPLRLPEDPVLEEPVAAFTESFGRITQELYTQALAPVLGRYEGLLGDVTALVERQFEIVRKGADAKGGARGRKPLGRAQGGFLFQARKLLTGFEQEVLPAQVRSLQTRVDTLCDRLEQLGAVERVPIAVVGTPERYAPDEADPVHLRRFKRGRRWRSVLARGKIGHTVPLAKLQRYYALGKGVALIDDSIRSVRSSSYRLVVQLGKLLNAASRELSAVVDLAEGGQLDPVAVKAAEQKVLGFIAGATELTRDLADSVGTRLSVGTHALCQQFADDTDRLDVNWLTKKERKAPKGAPERIAALRGVPQTWNHTQVLLLHRAQLALQMTAFQHRFSVLVQKVRNDVQLQVRGSVLLEGTRLRERLEAFAEAGHSGKQPEFSLGTEVAASFDGEAVLESLARDVEGCVGDLPDVATTFTDDTIAALESGLEEEHEEVAVSVRPLVKYVVETEFLDVIQQEIAGIPLQEQRTVTVAKDVARLLTFSLGDLEGLGGWSNDAVRKQVVSVARDGGARLERELVVLRATVEGFSARVGEQLQALHENTDAYALTSRSDNLSHYIRSREGQKAVSRVRAFGSRVVNATRASFVTLLYRRSSGVLLARRLRRIQDRKTMPLVDRLVALAQNATPKAGLLRALPFYYRQLFSGQARISETFWVGRKPELEHAKVALRRHEHGGHGAIFIVGETGAGKTALGQAIVTKYLARRAMFRINPPLGGSIQRGAMLRVLQAELKRTGDFDALLRSAPEGSVFVFDDLEMWWERSEQGMDALQAFIDIVRRYGDRHVFIANLNVHAWRFIGSYANLTELALSVIECGPLPAEALKSIISLRHGSTGIDYVLDGTPEADIAMWRQARLFTRYFDFSTGLVAVALRAWLSHIDKVDGNTLMMRWPKRPKPAALDELRIELRTLLLQLILHKEVTLKRLLRITGLQTPVLEDELGALVRMGLVRRTSQNVLHVDRFVAHWVTERLREQGMLA